MSARGIALGLALSLFGTSVARPQGLEIDHKEVGCIVVGKYPKMNACFSPAAGLARGRVYFRPEGTPSWYYVEMKSDQPCFAGVLPRPGKKLVGKKIEYYVEAQDKTFNAARTAEYGPIVVRSAQECKKQAPVAPFVNNATVAVFPGLPAGFVGGGIGTGAVIGIAAAGAAAAGTAAVVAKNNNDTTTTTVAIGSNTTTTVVAPTTTTTTTLAPQGNRPPFAVLTTNPDPPEGQGPLTITFNLCRSTDPDGNPLAFSFDFGDGVQTTGACTQSHTYAAGPFRAAGVALDSSYNFEGTVTDPGGLSQTRTRRVVSRSVCSTPTVAINFPSDRACLSSPTFTAVATANSADNVRFSVDKVVCTYKNNILTPNVARANATGSGPTYRVSLNAGGTGCFVLRAQAETSCGTSADASSVYFGVQSSSGCSLAAIKEGVLPSAAWESDLAVEGGRLQVVVNGAQVSFPAGGRSYGMAAVTEGENRVEATLVETSGKPGLWRLDFMNSQAVAPGSLHVIAGEVTSIGPTSVTFRLQGAAGERVAFVFRKR